MSEKSLAIYELQRRLVGYKGLRYFVSKYSNDLSVYKSKRLEEIISELSDLSNDAITEFESLVMVIKETTKEIGKIA